MTNAVRMALRILLVVVILYSGLFHLLESVKAVTPFDGIQADGPFQLYNSVRRVDAGQLPGRDFPCFHGLGHAFAHYPVYRLLGSDLFASELSRQLVSRLLGLGIYLLVSWLLTRSLWPGALIGLWSTISLNTNTVFEVRLGYAVSVEPDNSLVSLRGLVPLLMLGVLYALRTRYVCELLLGFMLGVAWLMGVDQAMAMAGSLVACTGVILLLRKRIQAERPRFLLLLFVAIASLLLLTTLVSQQPIQALRFSLRDIPTDQIWYFGVPPNTYYGDGNPYSERFSHSALFLTAVLFLWFVRGLLKSLAATTAEDLRSGLVVIVGTTYAGLALVSSLAIVADSYLGNPIRVVLFLLIFELHQGKFWDRFSDVRWNSKPIFMLLVSFILLLGYFSVTQVLELARSPKPTLSEAFQEQTALYLKQIRTTHPEPKTGDLWSTYAGNIEAQLGIYHPEVDYIIHALVERREQYIKRFATVQPAYVHTMDGSAFRYEEWLQTTTWPFYEQLILNYNVSAEANQTILWQRKAGAWIEPEQQATELTVSDNTVEVPASKDAAFAVIRLDYEIKNPVKSIPIFGQQSRYLVEAVGSAASYEVSLPPKQRSQEFPVALRPGEPTKLIVASKGAFALGQIRVEKATVRYIRSSPETTALLKRAPKDPPRE
jgi:hypothetical protein